MMKGAFMIRFAFYLGLLFIIGGCATMQESEIRKANFLSESFLEQVNKDITIISIIDTRVDKNEKEQKLLENKNLLYGYIVKPLKAKGYKPKLIKADTSLCGSVANIQNIEELSCLKDDAFDKGNLFLIISLDHYEYPTGIQASGTAVVSGILYSKSQHAIIWRDTVAGEEYEPYRDHPPGSDLGMVMLRGIYKANVFWENVYSMIVGLVQSIPDVKK